MNETVSRLPPIVEFILTRRVPCAVLAALMFTSVLWLPAIGLGIKGLAVLLTIIAMAVHLAVPALFALITIGGGTGFALQTGAIAALAAIAIVGGLTGIWTPYPGLILLAAYAVLTSVAASKLRYRGGLAIGAQHLAIGLAAAVLAAVIAGASAQETTPAAFVDTQLAPLFESLAASIPPEADQKLARDQIDLMRESAVATFPGSLAFSLWLLWMGAVLLARKLAVKYGFFDAEPVPLLRIRFGAGIAYLLAALLALGWFAEGTLAYLANNIAVVVAGLLAVQGVAVAHLWLRSREMRAAIVVMYLLLMWTMMVLPFVVIGILDIWFDYRRNIVPESGGK